MKKIILVVLSVMLLTLLATHTLADGDWKFSAIDTNTPRLSTDKSVVMTNEQVHLNWSVKGAESVSLKRMNSNGWYSTVHGCAKMPAEVKNCTLTMTEVGTFEYFIDAKINGKTVRSNTVKVSVYYSREEARSHGMDKIWKIQAMILRTVQTPSYRKSFSQSEVDHIRNLVSVLPGTLFNLSSGRMCAVITDVFDVQKPVTSISGEYYLVPGTDFSLKGYISNDTTLLMVFAPMSGHPKVDWAGLGGFTHTYAGHTFYMTEFSSALGIPGDKEWKHNGIYYDRATCAMVHEILHAVELNSKENGWAGFQSLHDAEANGYKDKVDWLDWYSDLMSDSLKNGKAGFREISFYVRHEETTRSRAAQ